MKLKGGTTFFICALLVLGIFFSILFFIPKLEKSQAAGLTCVSSQAGNWSDAATWGSCGGGVPGAADNATITHAVTLTSDIDITTGTLTVNSGGTLDTSVTNYNINAAKLTIGTGGLVTANGSIITLSGTGTVFTKTGTFNYNTSTFKYTGGTTATNIASATYYNLYLDHASTTYTAAGNITVTNVFTVNSGTFNASSRTITLSGTTGVPFVNNGIFTATTSTIKYTGDNLGGNTAILSATYNSLYLDNSAETYTASSSFAVGGYFTINTGTFTPDAAAVISGAGTLTGSGTARVTRTAVTPDFLSQYTITNKVYTNLTIEYTAAVAQTVSAVSYGNLKISTTSSAVATMAGDTTISGVLTISSGGTLNVSSHIITLTGAGTPFVNNGTFVKGTSTIRYAPYQTATVTAADYYNLEVVRSVVAMTDIWVVNGNVATVTKFDSLGGTVGTYTLGDGGNQPRSATVDAFGNVWVISRYYNHVTKLNSAGAVIGTWTIGTVTQGLYGIAIDAFGNVWAESFLENSVTKMNGSTGEIMGVYALNSGSWGGIAVDASGNVWVANQGSATVTKLSNSGETIGVYPVGTTPVSVAVDASGNIWVGNYGSNNVTKLNGSTGAAIGTYAAGSAPYDMAVDVNDSIWVVNESSNSVTKLNCSTGETIGTYAVGDYPHGVAVDGDGNIWVTNGNSNNVTKLNGSTGAAIGSYGSLNYPRSVGDFTGYALQHFTCGGSCGAGKDVTLSAGTFNVSNDMTVGDGTNPITVRADTNDPTVNVSGVFNVLANATFLFLPTVTTQAATSLATISATGNGNITNTGGENDTERGFKYGLTETDTWSVSDIGNFTAGAYTKNLTGLTPGTTYHIRAFVINSAGTSYGAWATFTTGVNHDSGLVDDLESETPQSNEIPTVEQTVEEIVDTLHDYNASQPTASFVMPTNNTTGSTVTFDASGSTSNKGIVSYEWDFGDGVTSNDSKTTHEYKSPGRYTVTLTVTDQAGNKNTTTQTIDIKPVVPTISNITAKGTALWIEGKSDPGTTVYFTIHSNPFEGQGLANKDGYWTYFLDNASEILGQGDHTIVAKAAVKLADNTELTGTESKTYNFKMTVDDGQLKVEMKKTKTWQILAGVFGFVIILLVIFSVLRRKRIKDFD